MKLYVIFDSSARQMPTCFASSESSYGGPYISPFYLHIFIWFYRKLSNGVFRPDDHKRLKGRDVGVPVFEAKMTRDTRLVYAIDCIIDNSGKVSKWT